MNAREYFDRFGRDGCARVAEKAGSNWPYFKQLVYRVRTPSSGLARKLIAASATLTPASPLDLEGLLYPEDRPSPALVSRKARATRAPAARRGA